MYYFQNNNTNEYIEFCASYLIPGDADNQPLAGNGNPQEGWQLNKYYGHPENETYRAKHC